MSRRGWLGLGALLLITLVGTLIAARAPSGSGPSALSPGPAGWSGARAYLEARGTEVRLLDRPLDADSPGDATAEGSLDSGVLVTGFPWSTGNLDYDFLPYQSFVKAGGTLIVAYSGQIPKLAEAKLFASLELAPLRARARSPLGYPGWRHWHTERWRLSPEPSLGAAAATVALRPPEAVPEAPEGAVVLYRAPAGGAAGAEIEGEPGVDRRTARQKLVEEVLEEQKIYLSAPLSDGGPVVFSLPMGDGRVVLLPADLFSNARLAEPGNADLLETLAAWAGDGWSFDEAHHGLHPPGESPSPVPRRVLDLFLAHLAALYLLACWHAARRFGPAWREPPEHSGSAAGLLRGLGSLHEKMDHHQAAGELLVERVLALEGAGRGSALAAALEPSSSATTSRELVKLAARVARARAGHGGVGSLHD